MSFKVDFSKFHKVSSTKDHTIMQHEDGHQLKVAHGPLSHKMRKQLEKLPAKEDEQKEQENPKLEESKKQLPKLKMADGGEVDEDASQSNPQSNDSSPLSLQVNPQAAMDTSHLMASASPSDFAPMPSAAQAPTPTPATPEAPTTPSASQTPQASAAAAPTASPSAPPNALAGYQAQEQAAQKIGEEESKLAQAKEVDYRAQTKAMSDMMSDYQKHNDQLTQERTALVQDIKDGHINPNHYLGKMDTGDKITTAIGLALGGLGAGATGSRNQALDFMNQQIDRDIDAQKSELGKKHTLLSANLEQTRDLEAATRLTKLMMNDITVSKLQQAESKAMDPMAKARAQAMIGQLQAQAAPIAQQQALRAMLSTPTSGNLIKHDPASFVTSMVPSDKQKEVFAQIEAAQDTKRMSGSIISSFDQAVKENTVLKTGGGLLRTPGSVYALHQAMQPTFKDLEGTVRQAAMDNTFKNVTPMPGDSEHTIDTKKKALLGYLQSKASAPMAKGFGIDLSKFESTAPTAETKTFQGQQYAKVSGGWQRVK